MVIRGWWLVCVLGSIMRVQGLRGAGLHCNAPLFRSQLLCKKWMHTSSCPSRIYTRDTTLAQLYPFLQHRDDSGGQGGAGDKEEEEEWLECWVDRNATNQAIQLSFAGSCIPKQEKPFFIDLSSRRQLIRQHQSSSELVARAIGKASCVVDMTAGLGRDAILLASAGKNVLCIEQNPLLHLLLSDALQRLQRDNPSLAERVVLLRGTSQDLLAAIQRHFPSPQPIAVYLDPMYPTPPQDRKALVKKETQVLHRIVQLSAPLPQDNDQALFRAALQVATERVVVKREMHDPPLASSPSRLPSSVVRGTRQRFDVYSLL